MDFASSIFFLFIIFVCFFMTHRTRSRDVDCHVSLCHSVFPIGDNITMLTTADWLLGSNSQSAAGLSTVGDNERTILGVLFFLFVCFNSTESIHCNFEPSA